MWNPELDGIDHYNIYSKSRSVVGGYLSNFAHTHLDLGEDGTFESVEGYWHWLGIPGDDVELRTAFGYAALQRGRQLKAERGRVHVPDFEDRIRYAIALKLEGNIGIVRWYGRRPLPLAHYYVGRDGRVIPAGHGWLVQVVTEELARELHRLR